MREAAGVSGAAGGAGQQVGQVRPAGVGPPGRAHASSSPGACTAHSASIQHRAARLQVQARKQHGTLGATHFSATHPRRRPPRRFWPCTPPGREWKEWKSHSAHSKLSTPGVQPKQCKPACLQEHTCPPTSTTSITPGCLRFSSTICCSSGVSFCCGPLPVKTAGSMGAAAVAAAPLPAGPAPSRRRWKAALSAGPDGAALVGRSGAPAPAPLAG